MAYLKFDKKELVNLEYSLKREFLTTNHAGGYLNTTISGCNTRKYHGLLVLPIKNFNNRKHLLLSSIDETLIQHGKSFNLGIHSYGEIYEPRGHKYITNLEIDKIATITYSVGGMLFKKSLLLCNNRAQLIIAYTLLEAHSPTTLRLKPFLAFRDIHKLSKANSELNGEWQTIKNGCSFKLYPGFPNLNLQLSKEANFISQPNWYYDIEYREESRRAFDSKEDLYIPGYFEVAIEKGETLYFSASTEEERPHYFASLFRDNLEEKERRDSYLNCLKISANQFITTREKGLSLTPGYPWMEEDLGETLIHLPALTLYSNQKREQFQEIMEALLQKREQFFTQNGRIDVPLWLFWTLQQYEKSEGEWINIWERFSPLLIDILNSYRNGERKAVKLHQNGLLWGELYGVALTWMNSYAMGSPIVERGGYQIEVNALWYNAICYAIELSQRGGDTLFKREWEPIKEQIESSFIETFKLEERGYYADFVGREGRDKSSRPNQLLAAALEYSPLKIEERAKILQNVKKELLTTKGIRTLSPKNPNYRAEYEGDQIARDMAYHQGTTRVWLLAFYVEAMFKLHGASFLKRAEELFYNFEEDLFVHSIGSLSEVYDGDPPHYPHGAPSYSGSVGALLKIWKLIEITKEEQL